jgi:hypothetical protein
MPAQAPLRLGSVGHSWHGQDLCQGVAGLTWHIAHFVPGGCGPQKVGYARMMPGGARPLCQVVQSPCQGAPTPIYTLASPVPALVGGGFPLEVGTTRANLSHNFAQNPKSSHNPNNSAPMPASTAPEWDHLGYFLPPRGVQKSDTTEECGHTTSTPYPPSLWALCLF